MTTATILARLADCWTRFDRGSQWYKHKVRTNIRHWESKLEVYQIVLD